MVATQQGRRSFWRDILCRWTPLLWSCSICSLATPNRSRFVQGCSTAFPRELPNGTFDLEKVCHCRIADSPLPSPVAEDQEKGFPRGDYQYDHQVRFRCSTPVLPTTFLRIHISLPQSTLTLPLWYVFLLRPALDVAQTGALLPAHSSQAAPPESRAMVPCTTLLPSLLWCAC